VREPPVERLHHEISSNPWIVSPLLDGLPSSLVHDDDTHTIISFEPVPPLLESLVVIAWAVGTDPDAAAAATPAARTIHVASSWNGPTPDQLTWQEVLALSREAHELLLRLRSEA